MAQKASDLDTLPLCWKHHQHGPHSYHVLGARRFIAPQGGQTKEELSGTVNKPSPDSEKEEGSAE